MNTTVKVISVDGDVWRFSNTNKKLILKKGAKLQAKDVLHLSEESNVVLQLSNGRVVEIHGKDLINNDGNFSLNSLLVESNSDIDKIVNFAKSFQQMNESEQQNDVVRLDDGRVFKKEGKDYVEIAGESFEGDLDVTQGGHRFVEIARVGETSIADGINPLMLNRVVDNIPPLGIEYPASLSVIKPFEHGLGGGSWKLPGYDNDLRASVNDAAVYEGQSLTHDVTLTGSSSAATPVTVTLSNGSATLGTDTATVVTVEYANGSTASFTPDVNGQFTVTVPAGDTGFKVIVSSTDDTVHEGLESYTISVATPEQSTADTGTGTIVDDDAVPTISVGNNTQVEGTNLVHTVSLSNPSSTAQSYAISLTGNTATAGTDFDNVLANAVFSNGVTYDAGTGQITVPAGVTSFTVGYTTTQDGIYEADETTTLTIGGSTGTGTITNDDAPTLLAGSARVSEEGLVGGLADSNGDDLTNSRTFNGSLVVENVETTVGLTYAFTGVPSDVLTSNGVAVVWTLDTATNTVTGTAGALTIITVVLTSATGAYTVTLNGAVDHADNSVEDILDFTIPTKVTGNHGASATSTLKVIVEDDAPSITPTGPLPSLIVDESNLTGGAQAPTSPYTSTATASFVSAFGIKYGADGAGSTVYSLSTVDGNDHKPVDLFDAETGDRIFLYTQGNEVWGFVGTTALVAFKVSVDTNGNVTLNQLRAIRHTNTGSTDEASAPLTPASIKLTALVTDRDGDEISKTLNIGGTLRFLDDAPTITVVAAAPTLQVDESALASGAQIPTAPYSSIATADFSSVFAHAYGADGAGTLLYSLTTNGAATGLLDSLTNQEISLVQVGNNIVGRAAGNDVFQVSVDANGNVTLNQFRSIIHANGANPDDVSAAIAANAITLTAFITDRDGDSANTAIAIGDKFSFRDDAPSVSTNTVSTVLEVDETVLNSNDSENFASAFTVNYGADGAGSTVYSLGVTDGTSSGLVDVASGSAILLYQVSAGVVEGRVGGIGGTAAFRISVIDAAAGQVELDQIRALRHLDTANTNEFVRIDANTVKLIANVTDKDGDVNSAASIDLGVKVGFRDDAPTFGTAGTLPTLTVDDSALPTGAQTPTAPNPATASFVSAFNINYGADGGSTAYSLSTTNFTLTNLYDTATGSRIALFNDGGKVVGYLTSDLSTAAFDVSVDVNGIVTLNQLRAIRHTNTANPDEASAPLTPASIKLTALVTDRDGDEISKTLDIGGTVSFKDDAPTITPTNAAPILIVDETNFVAGAVSVTANNFGTSAFTVKYGADGAASTMPLVYSLSVSSVGVSSALVDTATGQLVYLYIDSGTGDVIGRVGASGNPNPSGAEAFRIHVDAVTGATTLTQSRPLNHLVDGPTPSNHNDALNMTANLIRLNATATDKDGDVVTQGTDIGDKFRFLDDGLSLVANAANLGSITVDESALIGGVGNPNPAILATMTNSTFLNGVFTPTYGTDGSGGALVYSLRVASAGGVNSGLVDTATGEIIYLFLEAGVVIGRVGSGGSPDLAGIEAIRISLAGGEAVTLSQSRAVKHPTGGASHDESIALLNGALSVRAVARDGDGDTAIQQVNIGSRLTFLDDGPAFISASATQTVDEADLPLGSSPNALALTVNGSLDVNFGMDTGSATSRDVEFTAATITALEAWADNNSNPNLTASISSDGHTLTALNNGNPAFTVTLAVAENGDVTYEFTLQGPLTHFNVSALTLPFNDLQIIDGDGDTTIGNFSVTVVDDEPALTPKLLIVNEDLTNHSGFGHGAPNSNTFNTNADATSSNTFVDMQGASAGIAATLETGVTVYVNGVAQTVDAYRTENGYAVVETNGQITYYPDPDFSGVDNFAYTTTTDRGPKTYTVDVTVRPITNDVPQIPHDGETNATHPHFVYTLEDTDVLLGLKAPVITDPTDQNGVTTGDHPERLGAITLTLSGAGAVAGTELLNGGTPLTPTSSGSGIFTVVLLTADGLAVNTAYHHSGIALGNPNVNYLTVAQYEAIQASPALHRHENFNVAVSVTEYEVNDNGLIVSTPDNGTNGNTATQNIFVSVEAVTDDAQLIFNTTAPLLPTNVDAVTYGGAGGNTAATVTIKEDTSFIVNAMLAAQFADLDDTEIRSITITNRTGQDIVVNGSTLVNGASVTVNDNAGGAGQTGGIDSFPNITIGAAGNFSGDLNNIILTINAQDYDADGYYHDHDNNIGTPLVFAPANPATLGVPEADTHDADPSVNNNTVVLNLRVTPVAGDVAAGNVLTAEDTAVAFLQQVRVTDTGTGDERINTVVFTVPTDWKVIAPTHNGGWSTTLVSGTYTITFDASLSEAAREAVLDSFMIQPPAHSSKDVTINVALTSTDTNTTGSDTATVNLPIKITVTPVAEVFVLTGSDPIKSSDWSTTNTDGSAANANEDGNGTPDLTMNPDHDYHPSNAPFTFVDDRSISGYDPAVVYAPNTLSYNDFIANNHFAVEDTPFLINQDGFDLQDGWFNEDGKGVMPDANGHREETYATLSAYLDDKTTAVAGGTFEYFNGTAWVAPLTIAGVSVPVIPMEFLDQVRFTPPANFSGAEIAIKVQAVTKDYDEDAPFTAVTAVTGVAWLTSIFVLPKADSVTIGVNPREVMDEDTTRALTIRMKSTDPTEVFDADIKGIIAGAKIEFAGYVYDTAADSSTWVNGADRLVFDSGTGKYTLQLHNLPTGTINPIYTPPLHSNDKNVLLNVDVVSKAEYNGFVTISPVQTLPIAISVLGVPDAPILTTATGLEWIENNIDEHNGNGTSNDVLSINGAPNLIALSIFIPGGVTGGELAQSPSDTSETITLRITDLPVGFELTDANGNPLSTLAGGSGDARVWVLTPAQIATTQIKTPVNYSGTVDFTVQPVVTENDGRATKFALQTVEFKITPSPEATLNLSSNVWEDEIGGNIGRIDLSTVIQNGDNVNDEIYEVRILAADVTARNLILYSDAGGSSALVANGDGYYYIAQANLNSVYVRSPANYSGDINLNMDYIVRDTSSDTTLGPIYTGPTIAGVTTASWSAGHFNTISHTLHFRPVTDVVDMAFESFANTGGTVGTDIHASHPQYTLAGTGTVTVNLDITKAIDASSAEAENAVTGVNDRDYDYASGAGEHITRIVIDGVPDGVTVDGATFLGGGQWQITAADGFTGQIDKAVTFNVNRAINDVDGRDIYMTVYTQDKDAAITTDTVIVNIKTTFTGGTTVILPTLDLSPLNPTVLEDDYNDPDADGAGFALSKAVQLESVTIPTGGSIPASYDLTVTIRTYEGDDTTFTGAGISGPITVIENAGTPQEQVVTLWIVTKSVTDANAQSTLQGILDDIRVHTAEHANGNTNNLDSTVPIDVSAVFNSSGVARGDRVGGATDYDNDNADDAAGIVTITPVTDEATLTITQTLATNEGGTIPISITVSNEADESGDWTIVGGNLYFQFSGVVIAGDFQYFNGTSWETLTLQTVTGTGTSLDGGSYYVVSGATPYTLFSSLRYVISQAGMTEYESGSFNLNAWAINQENGSTLQLLSDGTTTLTVNKVNTPPVITVIATGSEHDGTPSTEGHIQLTINEIRMPADVGEVLSSAFIEGVPSGFIVYAGADEASAEATNLANNAGDGVWSLPVSGGDLPAYISIKPPAYWSGTVTSLSGLKLVLVSGETGLSPDATGFGFDLEVAPDADGIFALAPTYSFSNVGKPVSLNLNIGMEDPALIVVGAPDGNRELTRLIFTGIQDGANAVFLANNAMINPSRITYNAGTHTHTIEGLTQSELDTLQILHTPTSGLDPITVNAQTYEVDVDTGVIIDTSGLFGVQNFNLNVIGTTAIITDTSSGSPATPTAGNDELTGSSSNDYINADAGNDIIFGADGEDSLVGGLGNDELHGGNDKDILLGGAGNDYLYGDAANDILHGGTGNDILTGGAGADLFVWGTGDNDNSIDVITDFDTGDMVDVSGLLDQLGWDGEAGTLSNYIDFTSGTDTNLVVGNGANTVTIVIENNTWASLNDMITNNQLIV